MYLVDTNVISELRKGERGHPGVRSWMTGIDDDTLFSAWLVVGDARVLVDEGRWSAKGARYVPARCRGPVQDVGAPDPRQARSVAEWFLERRVSLKFDPNSSPHVFRRRRPAGRRFRAASSTR